MLISLPFVLAGLATVQAQASYAPSKAACGNYTNLVRTSKVGKDQSLNADEAAYIKTRLSKVPTALQAFMGPLSSVVYGGNLANAAPVIGISISGGGDRAALYGAGVVNALDGRNASSVKAGTGGLLQATSYISALSGGSWMMTSYIFNDMPMIYDMVLSNPAKNQSGWNLALDLFTPSTNATLQGSFIGAVFEAIGAKSAAGFDVTFGDWWARVLSYHFLPGSSPSNFFDNSTDHGASVRFSDAVKMPSYVSGSIPFTLIVANVLSPSTVGTTTFNMNDVAPINVVYEMSPLEFGSFDPSLSKFIPMSKLGTAAVDNIITGECVSGFDSASFITGISSNLFNLYNQTKNPVWNNKLSPVNVATTRINATFGGRNNGAELDTSDVPNPFQATTGSESFQDRNQTVLTLIDGGLNGEVDSIEPLIVPGRKLDLIVIVDSTANSAVHTPLGDSLMATVAREQALPAGSFFIPPLPTLNTTYIAQGLVTRPTFFGCYGTPASLAGAKSVSPYPFVVYLPNADEGAGITNTSTGQIAYNDTQSLSFLDATFTIATRGFPLANATSDANWPTCLACTTIERVRGREGIDRTPACSACFTRYCWNEVETAADGTTMASNSSSAGNSTATGSVAKPATAASAGARTSVTSVSLLAFIGGLAILA